MSKKSLLAAGLSAALVPTATGVAQAYPAGTSPSLGLSSYSRMLPGDSLTVSVSRVVKNCRVNIGWDNTDIAVQANAGKTGRIAPTTVGSPSVGGQYVLRASFGSNCADDAGSSVSKTINVGRMVRHSVAIKTTSSSAKRSPTLSFNGKIFWGAVPVADATVNLVLTKPNGSSYRTTATTDANGLYTASLGGSGVIVAGQYTVVATLPADDIYFGSQVSSRTVTIRN